MGTWLRRMFWLALLGGGAYGGYAWWRRERTAAEPPEWPPFDPDRRTTTTDAGTDTARIAAAVPTANDAAAAAAPAAAEQESTEASGERSWVEPVDGECPEGYPVKGNANSGIYHVPGGRSYDRTIPERCYASADDAEADGFRAAKA